MISYASRSGERGKAIDAMGEGAAARSGWWARNAPWLKTSFRVLLGLVWLINGTLKFTSGYVDSFLSDVQASQANAPSWLSGWYGFWADQASAHAALIVYTVGLLEILLGLALVLGLVRKIAYAAGAVLSLLIWAIPEGFGGPYQSGGGGTDVGTGFVYAVAFLGLLVINALEGSSRWSADHLIVRRFPGWSVVAELGPRRPPTAAPPTPAT